MIFIVQKRFTQGFYFKAVKLINDESLTVSSQKVDSFIRDLLLLLKKKIKLFQISTWHQHIVCSQLCEIISTAMDFLSFKMLILVNLENITSRQQQGQPENYIRNV